ncbi:ATPase, AAA family protein [Trichomonas vaginalis G3]|uniref:ATPase, AAA family protein n=1 Tax=Trichomonas vaginalis (strain ATCC PRA-98 / G3) TaxID=412133 RepID=A2E6V9_TRIV3|nr:DNA replication [Trichomonas vaginalis G3]EAY11595.1 ATPase, AAA family protein [Trichomonas vaginalis G3]KAI5516522.1 DNA replication [Trichomonas vaginalis G3]|eukprot:XP_001323818.1 ATPase, AAA family protein [Trichomonas vaginalis G3]
MSKTADNLPWVEKYRPKNLDDIVQQEEAVKALKTTLETGDLPHLIFHGPPGTGKTSLALALCRSLFGDDFRLRVKELNASDERGIDAVRSSIKEFASLAVPNGKIPFKIVILDEADSMTSAAQNALRRIIETYSSVTRFIIICNYVSKIIDPILSRCAKFRFKPLDRPAIIERLHKIFEDQNLSVDSEDTYETLVNISGGDLRKAITFAQSAASTCSLTRKITSEIITSISGAPNPADVENYFKTCLSADWDTIENATIDLVYAGYDIGQIFEILINLIVKTNEIPEAKKPELILKIAQADGAIINRADPQFQLISISSSIRASK